MKADKRGTSGMSGLQGSDDLADHNPFPYRHNRSYGFICRPATVRMVQADNVPPGDRPCENDHSGPGGTDERA